MKDILPQARGRGRGRFRLGLGLGLLRRLGHGGHGHADHGRGRRRGRGKGSALRLTVAAAETITPRMRSVVFEGEDLGGLTWAPGQDLVLRLPGPDGTLADRHYTIRDFDPAGRRLCVDFVLHGQGPGSDWARSAAAGQVVEAAGPRGRTRLLPGDGPRLFIGDETALPAILAMAEALPEGARATAIIEVEAPEDIQTPRRGAALSIDWVFRSGAAAGGAERLAPRLAALAPSPEGAHAYVLGATAAVRTLRHQLIEAGFGRGQITAEGYWRPGRVGGHDHVMG